MTSSKSTSTNIKISEMPRTDSEKAEVIAPVIQESDDGLGLDNYAVTLYTTETIDRLESESIDRDNQLQGNIDTVEQESIARDNAIQHNLDSVEYELKEADLLLAQVVDFNNTNSIARDNTLSLLIDTEVQERTDADIALNIRVDNETQDRIDADIAINQRIDNLISDGDTSFDELSQRIASETQNRATADAMLQGNIDSEESARILADEALGSRIDDTNSDLAQEIQNRIDADNALGLRIDQTNSNLSTESQARIDADIVLQGNIDTEESSRIAADEALASDISDNASNIATHATELIRLESDKEDNIAYGDAGYMAVVNDTGDGFEFVPQPSYDFIQMRGTLSEYTDGTDPDIFAVVSADPLNTHLYKDIPPNIPTTTEEGMQLSPNGYTYIAQENFETEITSGGEVIFITSGDFIIWTGVVWNHIPVEVGAGVDRINNLAGLITLSGTDGVTVITNTSNNTITVSVDSTVARTDALNAAIARIAANESEITNILLSIVYIEGVLADHETRITSNAGDITSLGTRVTKNEEDIETLYEDFDTHISNTTGNPHNVTYTQTGAAAAVHGHEWSEISSVPVFASRWPDYAEVTNKPATYPPSAHGHEWDQITDIPDFATRWPTFSEVTDKPTNYPPESHSHPWDQVTEKPAQATRWPTASEIGVGEFPADVTIPGAQVNGTVGSATTATNQSGGSVNATTGAFSGAVTIQPAESDNNPASKGYVDQQDSSLEERIEALENSSAGEGIAVGGCYLSMTANNPAVDLGYGVWTLISGDATLSFGDGAARDGAVIGANTHTLTAAQMPSHTHTGPSHTHSMAHTHTFSRLATFESSTTTGSQGWGQTTVPTNGWSALRQVSGHSGTAVQMRFQNVTTNTSGVSTANTGGGGTGATGGAGSGEAHNIQSARILINVWRRTE